MTKEQLPLLKLTETEMEFVPCLVEELPLPVYLYNTISFFAVDREGSIYKYTTREGDVAVQITNFALVAEDLYNGNYLLTATKDNIKIELEVSYEELEKMEWIYKLRAGVFCTYSVKGLAEYINDRFDIKII